MAKPYSHREMAAVAAAAAAAAGIAAPRTPELPPPRVPAAKKAAAKKTRGSIVQVLKPTPKGMPQDIMNYKAF